MAPVDGKAPGGRGIWPIVVVGSYSVSRSPPEPKVRIITWSSAILLVGDMQIACRLAFKQTLVSNWRV